MSCENNVPRDYIWILFETTNDLELFLQIVFEDLKSGDDFYDRGFPGWENRKGGIIPLMLTWIYKTKYLSAYLCDFLKGIMILY